MRKGYTTGSCAAAASKAAVFILFNGENLEYVKIETPNKKLLKIDIKTVNRNKDYVECSVIKDAGDDPDITNNIEIFAKAEHINKSKIEVIGGKGIGKVTYEGLKVPVGKSAINPVPMRMIKDSVREVLPEGFGVRITIIVPEGEKIAKKTYNQKLGIIGGISVLGTTGIVEPMSLEAIKDTMELELNIVKKRNFNDAIFVFGNYGEEFLKKKLNYYGKNVVKVSNFIGFMLEKSLEKGFKKILIAGHIGKLIKVSAGIFQTHSKVADARMEIITSYAALEGAGYDLINCIYNQKTTEAVVDILKENDLNKVFERTARNVVKRCKDYTNNELEIEVILFYKDNEILARS